MNRPLVILTCAFGLGIAAEIALPVFRIVCCLGLGFICLFYTITRRPYWASCGIVLGFVLLGSLRCISQEKADVNDIGRFTPGVKWIKGVVESDVLVRRPQESGDHGTASFTINVAEIDNEKVSDSSVDVLMNLNARGKHQNDDRAEFHLPFFGGLVELKGDLAFETGSRNPGAFDPAARAWRRGTSGTLFVSHPQDCIELSSGNIHNQPLLTAAIKFRSWIKERLSRSLSQRNSGVLQGILLGDKSGISSRFKEDFERTGTEHILATAGLHVGIVLLLIRGILWRIGVARRPALIFSIGFLVLFALMAGGRPAVARAALIAGIYLASILLEREFDIWNALALAALAILLWNPFQLLDSGFQLTFATVITIAHLIPFGELFLKSVKVRVFQDKLPSAFMERSLDLIVGCLLLSVAAQIGSIPLTATYFHTFSVVSILANTLAVPLLSLIIPLGFLTAFLYPTSIILAPLLSILVWIIRICSSFDWACFSVSSPHPAVITMYYLIIWYGAWKLKTRLRETSEEVPDPIEY